MPARSAVKKVKKEPVATWSFVSSVPRNGDEYITYETRLEEDGTLRCNCPGWIFAKKGQERGCKHTKNEVVQSEYREIYRKWQNGEEFGTVIATEDQIRRLGRKAPSTNADNSKIRYSRVLDMD